MGMFDSVYARCPKCGADVEFQSKAGPCQLRRYSIESIPPEIAESIEGDVSACGCGEVLKLKLAEPVQRVRMVVDDGREWD